MGKIRFYTDENVSKAVINGLRQRGADVLSAKDAGLLRATDDEHLARSRAENRVLFTHDEDFLKYDLAAENHPGVVFADQRMPVGEIIFGLMLIHAALEPAEMFAQVEYL